jgi:CRISPR-associated protein Cas2
MNEYFIIYDIADPKRLNRVARILRDYGQRVQKSKFEVAVSPAQLKALQQAIGAVIHPDEDGVKYFPLCEKCFGKTEIFGKGHSKGHDPCFEIL